MAVSAAKTRNPSKSDSDTDWVPLCFQFGRAQAQCVRGPNSGSRPPAGPTMIPSRFSRPRHGDTGSATDTTWQALGRLNSRIAGLAMGSCRAWRDGAASNGCQDIWRRCRRKLLIQLWRLLGRPDAQGATHPLGGGPVATSVDARCARGRACAPCRCGQRFSRKPAARPCALLSANASSVSTIPAAVRHLPNRRRKAVASAKCRARRNPVAVSPSMLGNRFAGHAREEQIEPNGFHGCFRGAR